VTDLLVPDASVLLKWVLPSDREEDADRALQLKAAWLEGRCELVVPALWAFEVGNVVGLKQPAEAEALLGAMLDLRLPEESAAACVPQAYRLMRAHGVTFYDAVYHGLAIARGGVMVTADRRYVLKARRSGHLQLLADWRPSRGR
jgi:predicted nucleic acid-binding protein